MNFEERDIALSIDGMGIVFFSPETNKDIPEGMNFLDEEYSAPEDVARHIKKGDVVGFCTGTGGDFILKFREGYPTDELLEEQDVAIRLGIDLQDDKLCRIDLFWLSEWSGGAAGTDPVHKAGVLPYYTVHEKAGFGNLGR